MAKDKESKGELVAANAGGYLALTSEAAAAVQERMVNFAPGEKFMESDLLRVKVPAGGGVKWCIPGVDGESYEPTLTGIMCLYTARGFVWPTEGQAVEGTQPVLITKDMIRAFRVGDDTGTVDMESLEPFRHDDGSYDWRGLTGDGGPLGWGTAANGTGKRAKEVRVVGILRPGDAMPLVLSIPGGSLKGFTQFMRRLPIPFFRAIVELSLIKAKNSQGIEFAQVVPKLVGALSAEQGEVIRANYVSLLSAVDDLGRESE